MTILGLILLLIYLASYHATRMQGKVGGSQGSLSAALVRKGG